MSTHMVFVVKFAEEPADPARMIRRAAETIAVGLAYFTPDGNGNPLRGEDGTFEIHAPVQVDTVRNRLIPYDGLTIVREFQAPGQGLIITAAPEPW